MKKKFKILSVLVLMFSIVGCGPKKEVKEEKVVEVKKAKVLEELKGIKLEDAAKILKKAGYSSSWKDYTSTMAVVTFDNPEAGITFDLYVNENSKLFKIEYTNRKDDYQSVRVYIEGKHDGQKEAIDSYLKAIKKIGLNREVFMDYAIDYLAENEPKFTKIEAPINNERSTKVEKSIKDANYLTTWHEYTSTKMYVIFDNPMIGDYFRIYIENDTTVIEIGYANRNEDIKETRIYSTGKYVGEQKDIDSYFKVLKGMKVDREDMLTYAVAYLNDYKSAPEPVEEITNSDTSSATTSPDTSSTVNSGSSNNTKPSTSGVNSEVTKKINDVNKKYDDLIKKAQGFIDKPSSYTLTTYTSFMKDYAELTVSYGELQTAVDGAGDSLSGTDAMEIYMDIVVKTATLIELMGKLPAINY